MIKKEIDALISIKNDSDILALYPKAKIVDDKEGFVFYNIKPNVWIKCYYFMKDGSSCRNFYSSNVEDIDHFNLDLDTVYTGNEKTEEYKYIWKYTKNN